jgi:cellulose synthase/poly-beta-1,6-N-acetylglucosamine synthase-like glycosyltransferase
MITSIALIFCCICFVIVVWYISFFRFRLVFFKGRREKQIQSELPPVSVIICAKNEEHNLKMNLPAILKQRYPDFEVIVVDDNSTDETYYVLKAIQQDFPNLRVIKLNENVNFFRGKKFPLSVGIREARNEHLLLTDADCIPLSDQWIRTIAENFTENREIVLGYGTYTKQKGFLNLLIRFETLFTAMQYFSFALAGHAYMGVGRNLAYKKQIFVKVKGFSGHYNLLSGDDDLFVNSVATKNNVAIEFHPDSVTVSDPKTTWKTWWKQKRRHLTTGVFYRKKHKILLSLYPMALLGFYGSLILAAQDKNNFYFILSLLLVKVILSMLVYKNITEKFAEKKLFIFSLFFELVVFLFYGIILMSNRFSKQGKWN